MNTLNVSQTTSARKCALTRRTKLTEQYDAENERCAQIIIANLDKYGHGSLLHQWASAVLNGPKAATREWWRRTA